MKRNWRCGETLIRTIRLYEKYWFITSNIESLGSQNNFKFLVRVNSTCAELMINRELARAEPESVFSSFLVVFGFVRNSVAWRMGRLYENSSCGSCWAVSNRPEAYVTAEWQGQPFDNVVNRCIFAPDLALIPYGEVKLYPSIQSILTY